MSQAPTAKKTCAPSSSIANQAGVALVNARLDQVVERRARQLQTVAQVSRKVAVIFLTPSTAEPGG